METDQTCEQCGLPLVECSALTIARLEVETYLRERGGYRPLKARGAALRLIPEPKRKSFP